MFHLSLMFGVIRKNGAKTLQLISHVDHYLGYPFSVLEGCEQRVGYLDC